jgi:O-antigen/teichoic acid export membrane protein
VIVDAPQQAATSQVQQRAGIRLRTKHHLANPLSKTAYSLILNSGLTAAAGFGYWVIAGRTYSAEAVGGAGAIISALTLVSAVGQLNLSGTLMRFLPGAGRRSAVRLIGSAYAIAIGLTSVLSLIALIMLRNSDLANGRLSGPQVVIAAAAWALFSLQDSVLVGLRRAPLVPIENIVFGIAKIVLLIGFVDRTSTSLVLSWALPLLALIPVINFLVFRRFLPAHDVADTHVLDLDVIKRFLLGDASTGLLQQAAVWLLPLIVTHRLGSRQNAGFYLALITSMTLDLLVSNLTSALTVEAAHNPDTMDGLLRTTSRRVVALLPIAVLGVVVLAPWIMRIYGSFGPDPVTTLQLLALACIPRAAILIYQAVCRVEHATHRSAVLQLALVTTVVSISWIAIGLFGVVGVAGAVLLVNTVGALTVLPDLRVRLGHVPKVRRLRVPALAELAALPELVELRNDEMSTTRAPSRAGPTVFAVAVGVLLHAFAAGGSRSDASWAVGLYWISLLTMFIPCAVLVISKASSDRDRIIVSMSLAMGILAARFALYPNLFAYHDELMHMNTVRLIVDKHRLFIENSALPVSTYYPGLEVATAGIHDLTGLSTHVAGMMVLGLSRLIMTLSLIGIGQRITKSMRTGCIAALIYTTNPQYLWFNSQFSYQSLALPLTLAVLYIILTATNRSRRSTIVGASAAAMGVAVSHHLTSVALLVALVVWWRIERFRRNETLQARVVGNVAGILALFLVVWTATIGGAIISYVAAIGQNSYDSLLLFFRGQDRHELFSDYGGYRTPVWERVLSLMSVALIMLGLLPAALASRSWLQRRSSIAIFLALVGLAYPIIPGGHLTRATSEVSDRASGFLFVGLGFLFAWWVATRVDATKAFKRHAIVAALVVLFVGGTVVGSGPVWLRLPGPYKAAAENRSVEEYNLGASRWVATHLTSDNHVLSDRINRLLVSSIGGQYSVTHIGDGIDGSPVFFDPEVTRNVTDTLKKGAVTYIVVDRRLAKSLPLVGVYLEQGEEGSYKHLTPIDPRALSKFDSVDGVSLVYDNGQVAVYDVREMSK